MLEEARKEKRAEIAGQHWSVGDREKMRSVRTSADTYLSLSNASSPTLSFIFLYSPSTCFLFFSSLRSRRRTFVIVA